MNSEEEFGIKPSSIVKQETFLTPLQQWFSTWEAWRPTILDENFFSAHQASKTILGPFYCFTFKLTDSI